MSDLDVKELSALINRSPTMVKLLLRRGVIKGAKRGGAWFGDRRSALAYAKQDHRPGPKPKARREGR